MYENVIEFENLAAYKMDQFRREADHYRLEKLARAASSRSYPTPYDEFLDRFGLFLVDLGAGLQRRASRCLPRDEFARRLT